MPIAIRQVEARAVRVPIAVPVRTSFGTMRDRPAVFLRVTDGDGRIGWGEAWCNFPSVGAEHRARLANEVVGPLLCDLGEIDPADVFATLMARLHVLALQSGEWGPLRQVAAGLDIAVHDLAARAAGQPLWRWLGGETGDIAVYASGIGPEDPAGVARDRARAGHVAFKLKVGFGAETDRRSLAAIRAAIGREARLMVDANQGWAPATAAAWTAEYAEAGLVWIEEPIRADSSAADWAAVAAAGPTPLAAGENINDTADFAAAIAGGSLRYLQPDAAKWGGISGCLDVARRTRAAGLTYCPHYLGGGIGLLASAHLLAAAGGDGMLEIDSNPNPLRDDLATALPPIRDGRAVLSEAPGIGPLPSILDGWMG